MPKSTFFHLSEEKQRRLLEAASIEFSRVALKEASIANIIKLAEIPRGSFYQYFEDKEDLYYYYFDLLSQDRKSEITKCVQESDGDLFDGMEKYFSKIVLEALSGPHAGFYKHFYMDSDYRSMVRILPELQTIKKKGEKSQKMRHGHQLYTLIDRSKLKIADEKEFKMVMQILMNIVFTSIVEGYQKGDNPLEKDLTGIINDFKIKLNWVKNGLSK